MEERDADRDRNPLHIAESQSQDNAPHPQVLVRTAGEGGRLRCAGEATQTLGKTARVCREGMYYLSAADGQGRKALQSSYADMRTAGRGQRDHDVHDAHELEKHLAREANRMTVRRVNGETDDVKLLFAACLRVIDRGFTKHAPDITRKGLTLLQHKGEVTKHREIIRVNV